MGDGPAQGKFYRDVEKLYRLSCFYNGNRTQLEPHVRMVMANFEKVLEKLTDGPLVPFDLTLDGVWVGDERVFHSEQPEQTFFYILFIEGVQSLLFLRDLSGEDLLSWLLTIREFLFANNGAEDLASFLWKNPYTNVRVHFFSALSEVSGHERGKEGKSQKLGSNLEEDVESSAPESRLAGRQPSAGEWAVPSGDFVFKSLPELSDLSSRQIEDLKKELSDLTYTDRAQKIVQFSSDEIQRLVQEFEILDEAHLNFNLLVQSLSLLSLPSVSNLAQEFALHIVQESIDQILRSFHGGLLLFVLLKLEELSKNKTSARIHTELKKRLSDGLKQRDHIKTLAQAFSEEGRVKIAGDLIAFLDRKEWPAVYDWLCTEEMCAGAPTFVEAILICAPSEFEQEIFSWGEERLITLLPVIARSRWPSKNRFLQRCLQSRSSVVAELAAHHMGEIDFTRVELANYYRNFKDGTKKAFLQSILGASTRTATAEFVRSIIQSGLWKQETPDVISLWVQVALKYLTAEALAVFDPVIGGRRLLLWAKFPRERNAILYAFLQTREIGLKQRIQEYLVREQRLLFQDVELKKKIKARLAHE